MMSTPNMDVIKDIPGYKVIVKAILKNQIQHLVEQLASTTDEECVILTASLTDGSLSHLGSEFGKDFIEDREDIKSQFLGFCLNKHYKKKQQENKDQEADTLHEMTLNPACEPGQNNVIKELDKHMIKVEPNDENYVSYLSENDKPSTASYLITEANRSDNNDVDDTAPFTFETNIDSDFDDNDETYSCQSDKLEAIAETLKTFAEHDSELEYEAFKPLGTFSEIEPDITGVKTMGTFPETEQGNVGVEPMETAPKTESEFMGVKTVGKILETHASIHAETKSAICNKCGKAFDESNLSTIPSENTTVKQFQCKTCFGASTLDGQPNRPTAKKSRKSQHECEQCGKGFSSKRYLKQHLAIHTGIKPFKCKICGKAFTGKQALTRHTVIHSGIKPFKCDICGKTLTHKRNLNAHRALHTGIHRFKCDMCGKPFTHKGNLKSHLASHLGVKPFKCDVCEKSFPRKRNLNAHLVIHSSVRVRPFKCDTCEKSFTEKSKLNRHLAIHSGIKSFKCDICGKSFTQKHNLTKHIASHSGEKR